MRVFGSAACALGCGCCASLGPRGVCLSEAKRFCVSGRATTTHRYDPVHAAPGGRPCGHDGGCSTPETCQPRIPGQSIRMVFVKKGRLRAQPSTAISHNRPHQHPATMIRLFAPRTGAECSPVDHRRTGSQPFPWVGRTGSGGTLGRRASCRLQRKLRDKKKKPSPQKGAEKTNKQKTEALTLSMREAPKKLKPSVSGSTQQLSSPHRRSETNHLFFCSDTISRPAIRRLQRRAGPGSGSDSRLLYIYASTLLRPC